MEKSAHWNSKTHSVWILCGFKNYFYRVFNTIKVMEKCSMNILLNFSFLVPQNKASIWVWNDMKMSERNNILIHQ